VLEVTSSVACHSDAIARHHMSHPTKCQFTRSKGIHTVHDLQIHVKIVRFSLEIRSDPILSLLLSSNERTSKPPNLVSLKITLAQTPIPIKRL
jgi:hypothetical protein